MARQVEGLHRVLLKCLWGNVQRALLLQLNRIILLYVSLKPCMGVLPALCCFRLPWMCVTPSKALIPRNPRDIMHLRGMLVS
jgi:hypothetical protein